MSEGKSLHGDKGAWDVANNADEHASDIEAEVYIHHVPAPDIDEEGKFYKDEAGNITFSRVYEDEDSFNIPCVASGNPVYIYDTTGKYFPGIFLADELNGYYTAAYMTNGDLLLQQYSAAKKTVFMVGDNAPFRIMVSGSRLGDTSNYTNFTTYGHQTMVGTARCWRDELGELIGRKTVGARVTDNTTEGTADFSDSCQIADDYKITNVQLNHDKDLTASIYPHLHWFQTSTNVPNWLLQYRWQVNGGVKTTSWTNYKCNTLAFTYPGTGTIHQIAYGAAIVPPSGSTISDIVQFRICRDTDNDSGVFTGADPLTGTASALSFDLHFMINSLGSDDEYSK